MQLHDLLTMFLNSTTGKGGIRHVVNGVGGSSTIANPDEPVTVTPGQSDAGIRRLLEGVAFRSNHEHAWD